LSYFIDTLSESSGFLPVAFFHTILGVGTPCAWQCSIMWRLRSTFASTGSTIQRGGTTGRMRDMKS